MECHSKSGVWNSLRRYPSSKPVPIFIHNREAHCYHHPFFICFFAHSCMFWVIALYSFTSEFADELTFSKGDRLLVVDCVKDSKWWRAETIDGRIGTIPFNYVKRTTPDPTYERFSTNAGVSLMDIIQFESEDDNPMINDNKFGFFLLTISRCFAFSICGSGEFIFQLTHKNFETIKSTIENHYPTFPIPPLPLPNDSRAVYKSRIYEFFHVCIVYWFHL